MRVCGRLAAALLMAWSALTPVAVLGRRRLDRLRQSGEPVVFAFWHGRAVLLAAPLRREGATLLVSRSRDGAWATALVEALGYGVVRGSTSAGAVAGFRGLLRRLRRRPCPSDSGEAVVPGPSEPVPGAPRSDSSRAGRRAVAIPVDGPRGPAESVAPGAVALARASGAWIVPLAAASRRPWRLRSWDGTRLPRPFARTVIAVGRPYRAGAGSDGSVDLAVRMARLHARLEAKVR